MLGVKGEGGRETRGTNNDEGGRGRKDGPSLRAEARRHTRTHGLKPVDQEGAPERGGGGR